MTGRGENMTGRGENMTGRGENMTERGEKMTVHYFWEIDSIPLPGSNNAVDVVQKLRDKFGYGNMTIVGKAGMHKADHLNNISGVTFMDAKEPTEGEYELIEEIDGTQWLKGDRIVLLSVHQKFEAKLKSLKTEHGVEVVVICKKSDYCPLECDADKCYTLDAVLND